MFANNKLVFNTMNILRRSFHASSISLVRQRKQYLRKPGFMADNFKEDVELLQEDPEGFGNMESDFMGVHKTHKEHRLELARRREHVRHVMVRHKYFREPQLPNLLFYAEKEQIRLLHARDPEEWTPERLAESFPATPDIIRKILAARWTPHSLKRLQSHDEAVTRNWQALADNSAEYCSKVPRELRQHLLKFYDRKGASVLPPELAEKLMRPELPKPKNQEFLSIITSCPKYQKEAAMIEAGAKQQSAEDSEVEPSANMDIEITNKHLEKETYLLGEIRHNRQMRLEDLKNTEIWSNMQSSQAQAQGPDAADMAVCDNPSGTGIVSRSSASTGAFMNFADRFESNEIMISNEDQKRFEISKVKDRIHIPRKLFKPGATYRVDDSYYDDDGEFLYRVPGMVGVKHKN